MAREAIPKKVKEVVLNEYDHTCAVCGENRPHIHHIDEDATNNDDQNLLPLCPNCHLRDQHNPTKKIEIGKLQLFRKYKDPFVLKPQFHPLFIRLSFFNGVEINESSVSELEEKSKELIEFVQSFAMGEFYGKRLEELIGRLKWAFVRSLGGGPDPEFERQIRRKNTKYREKLVENREQVEALIVELLRYQKW